MRFQFRVDMVNAFNHTNRRGVSTKLTSCNFGKLTSVPSRAVQLNGRFSFSLENEVVWPKEINS